MEVARHVVDRYFLDTPNPLVRHHLDSFEEFLKDKIPGFIHGTNPQRLVLEDRSIEIYIGGLDSKQISYILPTDESGAPKTPNYCRLNNETYLLEIRVQIDVIYTVGETKKIVSFPDILFAKIPLMLKSHLCYLTRLTPEQMYEQGECRYELGGYFIIGGAEKSLLVQERLSDNMMYASKRAIKPAEKATRGLIERSEAIKIEDASKESIYEYIGGIRSISNDGTRGPFSHFLIIPPANTKPDNFDGDVTELFTRRLATITLPGFTQPVPLISIFRALGLSNDQDIYDTILCGLPDSEKTQYDEIFMELMLSHDKFIKSIVENDEDGDLLVLTRQTRSRSQKGVYINLYSLMFPHCEFRDESPSSLYRRKAFMLGELTRKALDVALGNTDKTDRDHYRFKRLSAGGELCFQEFRKVFKDVSKRMLLELDTRIHFQEKEFAGIKLQNLIREENVGYYWRNTDFINHFEKSFKGKWGGKDGVSQELSRLAYLGTIAQLRRVNLDMDKNSKSIDQRRIHGSSWGMLCPSDNPDGGNVGMIKSLTVFCSISTSSPVSAVLGLVQSLIRPITLINPSAWNPVWTKIYLNSDFIGVSESDTEKLHSILLSARRAGTLNKFVSLCWDRFNNIYKISTDAGRPCRPVYIPGTKPHSILSLKSWTNIQKHIDFIDPEETESLKISMTPFHDTNPSEIHGTLIFSSSTCVLSFAEHNASVRNAFSCQQTKQACSWYNTAFTKRFDTIATWLHYPQRPLTQTWYHQHVMGSGCLAYGENPIVALMIHSGYNQEDSVLMNDASLRRGMFNTTLYHSYDIQEEMINQGAGIQTEFANLLTNPKYRETVARQEGFNYDDLDQDGIIKVGSKVDENTILIGVANPVLSESGQIKSFRDSSIKPNRGQKGIIDAVYRYTGQDGTRCVKIRVAELRIPVLGDKFSARHGQKGTVGLRIAEEDMPYTAKGLRPDMIVNPHAFPSRMTIGMFLEMTTTKLGVHTGTIVDGTPFSSSNRIEETKNILLAAGMHPYGHEILYNGLTGEMIEAEIFMGPNHYLRLKQMVEDKINYRTTGPRKLLTHQPVEGRSNGGGLRIGNMELDGLVSHGISRFINESFMERSDKSTALFQPETGRFDSNSDIQSKSMIVPYSLNLAIHEMEAMHISVKLDVD